MIEIKNLSIAFDNKQIFKDFSYTINNNCIYAILGKSGIGKTTLFRAISGLLKDYTGQILVDGILHTNPSPDICMMHQHYTNFPWKQSLDNILFPIKINRKVTEVDIQQASDLLNKVGLADYAKSYPMELSGGMNQRLALARALFLKPKVLLMDEPLSALDPVTRKDMQQLILNFQKENQNIIIIITHDENEADIMSNNILNFNRG